MSTMRKAAEESRMPNGSGVCAAMTGEDGAAVAARQARFLI
jgi:hypothetical protein